jgi:hypothetical protein
MANHLTLKKMLFEFDAQGNLNILSNGRSVRLPKEEVVALVDWLSQEERPQSVSGGQALFTLNVRFGEITVSRGEQSLRIPAEEVGPTRRFLARWFQLQRR